MDKRAVLALASGSREELLCAALASQDVAPTTVLPSAHLETEIMRVLHDAAPPPLIVVDLAVLAQLATSVGAFCAWKRAHCSAAPLVLYCSALYTVRANERAWAQGHGALDLVGDCAGWLGRASAAPALQQLLAALDVANCDEAKLSKALDALPATQRAQVTAKSPLGVFDRLAIRPEELVAAMRGRGGPQVGSRRYRLKTYEECFVGSAAVDWISRKTSLDREQAVQAGQALLELGHIYHVVRAQPFIDGPFFYRFSAHSARLNDIDLQALLTRFRSAAGVPIRDRKFHAITYPACFTGSTAVSWLRKEYALSHNEAMTLGQRLLDLFIVHHVADEHGFREGNFFYRFYEDERMGYP